MVNKSTISQAPLPAAGVLVWQAPWPAAGALAGTLRIAFFLLICMPLPAGVGDADERKPAPKATVRKAETEVPAGAKHIGPNRYRYVDPKGIAWIYTRTPFGLSKHEETPEEKAEPAAEAPDPRLTIEEDGDKLHFRRKTVFGESKWTKKKSELTDDEKSAWDLLKKQKAAKPASKE
ncbi:MAG: hypothetical protein ACRD44_10085 [Bryobacteraceae bacterium]